MAQDASPHRSESPKRRVDICSLLEDFENIQVTVLKGYIQTHWGRTHSHIYIYIQIFIIMIHGGNAVYLMLILSIVCVLFLIIFATFSFEDEVSPELTQPLIFIRHAIHLEVVALGSKTGF